MRIGEVWSSSRASKTIRGPWSEFARSLVVAAGLGEEPRYDLAGWVAGEGIDEVDVAGDGVVGEFVADPVTDGVGGEVAAGFVVGADDPDGDTFEGVFVVDTAGVDIGDAGHGFEGFGDGLGVDVLAADDDHVVVAAKDMQAALFIEVAAVAHLNESIDHDQGCFWVGVALQGGLVVEEDAAGLALGDFVAVVVVKLDGASGDDVAGGGGVLRNIVGGGDGGEGQFG